MDIPKDIYQRITKKHGTILNLQNNPAILEDILRELRSIEQDDFADYQTKTASPFNVPWMDSWAANWLLHQQSSQKQSEKEFNSVLGQLIDLKFRERLNELREFIGRYAEPPDAGPPEPGTPPAGPQSMFASPPPDPPPPDTFRAPPPPDPEDPDSSFMGAKRFSSSGFNPVTEPPDGGPPEPGVPNPPDPGPAPGPDAGALRDNPWILYWFVSINAPLILNMIDAHITRRLNDLKMQTRKK
jgi:hypothetical protein